MNNSDSIETIDQHSLLKSFLLHIVPGILTTLALVIFKPFVDLTGFPPLLAFLLAVLLIDIPIMLGVLLNEGRKLQPKTIKIGLSDSRYVELVGDVFKENDEVIVGLLGNGFAASSQQSSPFAPQRMRIRR